MKTSSTKETKKGANELTEAFALWLHKSKADNEYLSGLTTAENGDVRLIGANSVPLERLIAGETPSDTTPDITETTEQGDDQQ